MNLPDWHDFPGWINLDARQLADDGERASLLWLDIETTGLEESDVILEFGAVATTTDGAIIPDMYYHAVVNDKSDHYRDRLASLAPTVKKMHTDNGLLDELDSHYVKSAATVSDKVLEMLAAGGIKTFTMKFAGNSIHYDSGFIQRYMPKLYDFMFYRQINVSTLKELCSSLNPDLFKAIMDKERSGLVQRKLHRSVPDLMDSLNEFDQYLDNFLIIGDD